MDVVKFKIIGCGDAFGSGGRLNTSFLIQNGDRNLLVDCGASTLPGLKEQGFGGADADAIVISHFHGDHYAGIPFLLMDAAYAGHSRPLQIITPPGGEDKIKALLGLLYPGSDPLAKLQVTFSEYRTAVAHAFGFFTLEAWPVLHTAESQPHGLRIGIAGKVISYSGDTSWTDTLWEISRGADLFLCECNFYDTAVAGHLDFITLRRKLRQFTCKQLLLTHLGPEMLNRELPGVMCAEDGMELLL